MRSRSRYEEWELLHPGNSADEIINETDDKKKNTNNSISTYWKRQEFTFDCYYAPGDEGRARERLPPLALWVTMVSAQGLSPQQWVRKYTLSLARSIVASTQVIFNAKRYSKGMQRDQCQGVARWDNQQHGSPSFSTSSSILTFSFIQNASSAWSSPVTSHSTSSSKPLHPPRYALTATLVRSATTGGDATQRESPVFPLINRNWNFTTRNGHNVKRNLVIPVLRLRTWREPIRGQYYRDVIGLSLSDWCPDIACDAPWRYRFQEFYINSHMREWTSPASWIAPPCESLWCCSCTSLSEISSSYENSSDQKHKNIR